MTKKKYSTQDYYEKLCNIKNIDSNKKVFNTDQPQTLLVNIIPDKTVSLGKFRPDPLARGAFRAHPKTIRALNKDIFVAGDDEFIDLEKIIVCNSCNKKVDLQFWKFCPFCETSL